MTSNKLPNLFIVGAPKCGTTAWAEYLGSHKDIFFPPFKDHCYFAHDLPNLRLTRSAEDYATQFAEAGNVAFVGEASAMYLFSTAAAAAIHAHDPAARILIFLREQEEYLPSLHNQFLREFAEEIEDFETAWRLSGRRPAATIPQGCLEARTLDYAAMGRFAEQVERYLDLFSPRQVHVVRFADWTADPRKTYLEILNFLGVEDDGRTDFPAINAGMTYRSRKLARWIKRPAPLARWAARIIRALPLGGWLDQAARRIGYHSTPGYRTAISPALHDEIRHYFAKENGALERRLGSLQSRESRLPK